MDSALDRIDQVAPHVKAYVAVTAEQARGAARGAERKAARDEFRAPLHGVPAGLKDLIDVAGSADVIAVAAVPMTVVIWAGPEPSGPAHMCWGPVGIRSGCPQRGGR
ncbi:amidase family protein [Streptomyces sp. NPDC059134]|uniref:amidase family protein n=1 Tax=Streptomyces sp. NPDC059134 TaxID=3346738 RepID=UPI00367FE097